MAERPIFIPNTDGDILVREKQVTFTWHPGFAISQAQKSIRSLHRSASQEISGPILEISTKSPQELGQTLSAFNLSFRDAEGRQLTVETAFQGSKVFKGQLQYTDLYVKTAREAKRDERLKESGPLVSFRFEGQEWPLEPKTAFYDWLYLRALHQNPGLANDLLQYRAFTDIMFNPKKSINCQAHSAALYASLSKRNLLNQALSNRQAYLSLVTRQSMSRQDTLF